MPGNRKPFWITISLLNLCIVALFGFALRSKILFSLPWLDYQHLLSAHSHFAFAGWAGLGLITLLIYELLPPDYAQRKFYQFILTAIQLSALGMAVSMPVLGYTHVTMIFTSLYLLTVFIFTPVFIRDLVRLHTPKSVVMLSSCALSSVFLSALGPLGLAYILLYQVADATLYRYSLYTFLHFQYNGFFTLAVFALFLNAAFKKGFPLGRNARFFSLFLCLSVVPSLFLSLLWHNTPLFYTIAAAGCGLLLLSLFYFLVWVRQLERTPLFYEPAARTLWILSAASFALKMLLNIGTIVPALGQAVYGDRPVIIGFLHLVFLGFLSFFLLALYVEHGFFKKLNKTVKAPFIVFGAGIITNEVLLMLQGLGILFQFTTVVFNWLLWGSSILLFTGALLLAITRFYCSRGQR